ncbi:MAG: hypothetical protein PWQ29_159 [Verrucomicrobiota bacterium]|nr:hypothetical protein [Verrucomicrobiota bacterium]MDK2962765.1 hypothetical protein [Verrucomicrobiota bacterium]
MPLRSQGFEHRKLTAYRLVHPRPQPVEARHHGRTKTRRGRSRPRGRRVPDPGRLSQRQECVRKGRQTAGFVVRPVQSSRPCPLRTNPNRGRQRKPAFFWTGSIHVRWTRSKDKLLKADWLDDGYGFLTADYRLAFFMLKAFFNRFFHCRRTLVPKRLA